MHDRSGKIVWLTAAECARRMGLSVRALHLYERYGLITPRRTEKQWRLYGVDDIARLNEVLALKSLGLSLSNIANLLEGKSTDLGRTLAMQREVLTAAQQRASKGLALIETLNATLAEGGIATIDDLIRLAKETDMTDLSRDDVAWRRYEQNRPRTQVAVDPTVYSDFAGYYQLQDGPFYVVTARDGSLFTRVVGQADIEIFPESETQFFMKVLPVQVTFNREDDGSVNSLVHHQNGSDTPAQRVDEDVVRQSENELQRRIREKIPVPNSEVIIRRVIEEHLRGEPNFAAMSPNLAVLAREQAELVRAELLQAGSLKKVSFRGVNQSGFDVYDVEFERTQMEWGFAQGADEKLSGLYLRRSP